MGVRDKLKTTIKNNLNQNYIKRFLSIAGKRPVLMMFGSTFKSISDKYLNIYSIEAMSKAYRDGAPVAYGSLFLPYELLHGLGLVPFLPEVLAGFTAGMGIAPNTLKKANSHWYSPDLCTFHRSASGAVELNLFPRPQAIICTNLACDAAQKSFYGYAHKFKMEKDYHLIDIPYHFNPEAVDYVSSQLEQISNKISNKLGRKLDLDALSTAIENSNRFRYWALKVNEVRKNLNVYPSDYNGLNFILPFHGMAGTPQAVSLYKKMYKELSLLGRKADDPAPKKRLLWLHLKPYYKNEIFSLLAQGNCMVAFEEINHVYWPQLDPATPFRSLAVKMLSHYLGGSINNRLKVISQLTADYHMDGAILFSHWGCRQNNAAARLIKDHLRSQGLPVLIIDGDCVDQNNYSPGQLQTRIQGFMELLGSI